MSNKNIQDVEDGLLTAISIHGLPKKSYNLMDRMKYFNTPGVSIAVIHHGEIDWARGFGVLEADGNEQVSPETLFQAASISKPVSAMLVLKLVNEGKLDLDMDVNQYLSSWQVAENDHTKNNPVTLRGILSHTAGLTVHGFPGYGADADLPSLLQILNGEAPANTSAIQVDVAPGSLHRYSGGGYTVMQQLLESKYWLSYFNCSISSFVNSI